MFTTIASAMPALSDAAVHGPWIGGWGGPWFLLFPLFWLIVIVLFIFFGRRAWRRNRAFEQKQGAESVLRERYARGEVDETEYRQRLEVLRTDHR